MSPWPNDAQPAIDRFVRALSLRHRKSPATYRAGIGSFDRFVRADGGSVTEDVLRRWLVDRAQHWAQCTVEDRARKVVRFLDFLVAEGSLPSHPCRASAPGEVLVPTAHRVRALLSPDPAAALAAFRPPAPFASSHGPRLRAHIELKRAMGCRYHTPAVRMQMFDAFLQQHPEFDARPLSEQLQAFADPDSSLEHRWLGALLARDVTRAFHRLDPSQPIAPVDRALRNRVYRARRRPYIYTEAEVSRALATAAALPVARSQLRPATARMMLLLAYCAGLRIGELLRLDLRDVDFTLGTITVRESKFFKTRRLPLDPSALAALQQFLSERRRTGAPERADSPLFGTARGYRRYSAIGASGLLIDVLRRSGIKPPKGSRPGGPRIHDLRHSFVVHRLLAWYREGVNPESRLPYLATYLGHKDIHSTLIYITVNRELLSHAGERFRQIGEPALSGKTGGT